jgi:acetyl esterase
VTLDPQIAQLIDALDAGFPPLHTMTGTQARAVIRSRYVPPDKPENVGSVTDTVVAGPGGDIPVRIYRPESDAASLPCLVYAHGGGFVFCDLDSHDGLCRNIANLVPAIVVSVAYRLAPENRFPPPPKTSMPSPNGLQIMPGTWAPMPAGSR